MTQTGYDALAGRNFLFARQYLIMNNSTIVKSNNYPIIPRP
jgi:hypothetical protein